MTNADGTFISFEGIEGSGKSTQMRLLVDRLRSLGRDVVENQEPGATAIGKQIRRILLDPQNGEMAAMAELLLMFASRAQAAAEIILPALWRGAIVVSDRFTDSSLAYQGYARGLGFEKVMAAHQLALGSLQPNLTIAVDVDVATGLARAIRRNLASDDSVPETRIDGQSPEFHLKVAEGYRRIATSDPRRFHLIDGRGEMEEVAERIWPLVAEVVRA